MSEKVFPKCSVCETVESLMWRQIEGGQPASEAVASTGGQICQDCYKKSVKFPDDEVKRSKTPEEKKLRKSTRISRKSKLLANVGGGFGGAGGGKICPKGSGKIKRIAQKKCFIKTPSVQIATKYVTSVSHNGSKIRIGDIVSLMDAHDNLFYAQIRGLTVDMYCDKHAFITWLIPTQSSPPPNERFDASTYLIGHDEDTPRSLNLLEFVMHAPSSYYHDKMQPQPMEGRSPGYTWTRLKRRHLAAATATSTVTCQQADINCQLTEGVEENINQNIVTTATTTTTATVTIATPSENVTECKTVTLTDNGAVTLTATTTTTTVAAVSSTTSADQ